MATVEYLLSLERFTVLTIKLYTYQTVQFLILRDNERKMWCRSIFAETLYIPYQEKTSPGMTVGRAYLLQEVFRQMRIDVWVIAGPILHVHQKHLCRAKHTFSRIILTSEFERQSN